MNVYMILHLCTAILWFSYLVGWNDWPAMILLLPSAVVMAQRVLIELFWTVIAVALAYGVSYVYWLLFVSHTHSGGFSA